jgi:RNA polymerase sigma-70 factor (ECF subfamily)
MNGTRRSSVARLRPVSLEVHRCDLRRELGVGIAGSGDRFDSIGVASFEEFYRSEFRNLVAIAYQMTGGMAVAEDLAQDAMVQAYRKWGRVSTYERPDLWVRRTVLTLARSRWRRQRTAAKYAVRLGRTVTMTEPPPDAIEVWRHVHKLAKRQAESVVLYYGCDMSVDDVARTLECTPGTVRTHLARARVTLAGLMADVDDTPGGGS